MTARRRKQGQVAPITITVSPAGGPPKYNNTSHNGGGGAGGGAGAQGNPPLQGAGMRIKMTRIAETDRDVLQQAFWFQMPPLETFSVQHEHTYNDYETIRAGVFTRATARQLRTMQFQSLFVDYNAAWTNLWGSGGDDDYGPNSMRLTRQLRRICESGTPFSLKIGQPRLWTSPEAEDSNWDVDILATLRTIAIEERAGEPDARYVDVSFTEYRRLEIAQKGKGGLPTQHTINHGDTLRDLAKHYYHESRLWRLIAKANGLGNYGPDKDLWDLRQQGRRVHAVRIPKPPNPNSNDD